MPRVERPEVETVMIPVATAVKRFREVVAAIEVAVRQRLVRVVDGVDVVDTSAIASKATEMMLRSSDA